MNRVKKIGLAFIMMLVLLAVGVFVKSVDKTHSVAKENDVSAIYANNQQFVCMSTNNSFYIDKINWERIEIAGLKKGFYVKNKYTHDIVNLKKCGIYYLTTYKNEKIDTKKSIGTN